MKIFTLTESFPVVFAGTAVPVTDTMVPVIGASDAPAVIACVSVSAVTAVAVTEPVTAAVLDSVGSAV